MGIVIIVEIPGGTLEQYDKMSEAMRLNGEDVPPGLIVHFAGLDGDTLIVTDVWESQEAYDAHLAELGNRGRESVAKIGLPPYTHRRFELHKIVP